MADHYVVSEPFLTAFIYSNCTMPMYKNRENVAAPWHTCYYCENNFIVVNVVYIPISETI